LLRYKTFKIKNDEFDCICYGLAAEKLENGAWNTVAIVKDVSPYEEFVSALAQKCTSGQLDPIHILDIVLDAIS